MDDKQRLYERLNGMVTILDMIIKLGEQFNMVSILRDIDDLMKKLELEGCNSRELNIIFEDEGDNKYEVSNILQ